MGVAIVFGLLSLSVAIVVATFCRLRRAQAGRGWWTAFSALVALGLLVGCWLAFSFEYHVSPQIRYASFPVPLAVFRLEDGLWVDYVTPAAVMYPGVVANVLAIVAVALLPVLLASVASGRKRKGS
jgi:hypothetical protein